MPMKKRDKRDQIQFIAYKSDKALTVLLITEWTVHTCVGWCKEIKSRGVQKHYKFLKQPLTIFKTHNIEMMRKPFQ